jgi:hypothetical protein
MPGCRWCVMSDEEVPRDARHAFRRTSEAAKVRRAGALGPETRVQARLNLAEHYNRLEVKPLAASGRRSGVNLAILCGLRRF